MLFGPELRARLKEKGDASGSVFEGVGQKTPRPEELDTLKRRKGILAALGPASLLVDDVLAMVALTSASGLAAFGPRWLACAVGSVGLWMLWRVCPPRHRLIGVRIVCISDSHGQHRKLDLPKGDILIHAGDFTKFGNIEDAKDFNTWLGELPFEHKIVVNGNHESNAEWQPQAAELLSNACFLKYSSTSVKGLSIHGTDFCWPMKTESPYYAKIPRGTDVVIAHGPAKGLVDGDMGCNALLWAMGRVRPRLVISGHIHEAHGQCNGRGSLRGTTFVNAANCRGGYSIGWGPIVVDL